MLEEIIINSFLSLIWCLSQLCIPSSWDRDFQYNSVECVDCVVNAKKTKTQKTCFRKATAWWEGSTKLTTLWGYFLTDQPAVQIVLLICFAATCMHACACMHILIKNESEILIFIVNNLQKENRKKKKPKKPKEYINKTKTNSSENVGTIEMKFREQESLFKEANTFIRSAESFVLTCQNLLLRLKSSIAIALHSSIVVVVYKL